MKTRFRKAMDGGNLIVIGVAIATIAIIGMYLFAQDMMSTTANKQSEIGNALIDGINELKK